MTHTPISLHRSSRERFVIACVSLALIFAGIGLLVALSACSDRTPAVTNNRGPAAATYTVRGQVETLPGGPVRDITIKHEAIPTFKDETGQVKGMSTMSMPFPIAEGVSIDGIAPGDIVELEFVVWWKPVAYRITRIQKLPADTKLTFGP